MIRTLPRPIALPRFPIAAGLIALAVVSLWLSAWTVIQWWGHPTDWLIMERAARLAGSAELYNTAGSATFVWSPVAAYPLILLAPLGYGLFTALHFALALAFPTWPLRIAVLLSWPFWTDVAAGNILTLIFLVTVYALRGHHWAIGTWFALALLIPRPLLVPIGLYLLWTHREWWWPFAAMFVGHALLVWWTGLGPEWIGTLLAVGSELQEAPENIGPSRFVGYWWLVIGLPLAGWLAWKGRLGWAGLALSPYVWSYYLFWILPWVNQPMRSSERNPRSLPARRLR